MDIKELSPKDRERLHRWHKLADILFNKYRFFGSRKIYRLLSKVFLPSLKSKIFSPTIYGFDLVVGKDNSHDLYYLGFYEPGTLHIMKNTLFPGDVFVDVGANIGLMSFYAATLVGNDGKVVAIEPTERFFKDLTDGIEKNNFNNILPLKIGLGARVATVPIYHNPVCPSILKTDEHNDYEMILLKPLDDVVQEIGLNQVKFIKIDVEGYESEVIKGGEKFFSSPNAPIICFEFVRKLQFQMNMDNSQILFELLKSFNSYRFYQLEKSYNTISKLFEVSDFNKLHDEDNIFCILEKDIHKYEHIIKKI